MKAEHLGLGFFFIGLGFEFFEMPLFFCALPFLLAVLVFGLRALWKGRIGPGLVLIFLALVIGPGFGFLAEKYREEKKVMLLGRCSLAAKGGNAQAQYELGMRYLNGNMVERDTNRARYWIEKSAAQNSAEAKAALQKLGKP